MISLLVAVIAGATCSDAYCRNRTNDTDTLAPCLYWPENTTIVWRANDQGNPETPGDTEFTAFQKSFATWQTVLDACASLKFQEGARSVRRDVGWSETDKDPQNNLIFRFRKCDAVAPAGTTCNGDGDCANAYDCWEYGPAALAVTTTSFDKRSGRIWDADVEFNVPTFSFTAVETPVCGGGDCNASRSNNCICSDVQNTVTHEIGHMLGLAHTTRLGSTMAARADPGETTKRVLDTGTASFVCDIYPKGRPSKSCVIRPLDPNMNIGKAACAVAPGEVFVALSLLLLRRRR